MIVPLRRVARGIACAATLTALVPRGLAQTVDPFAPGERWSWTTPALEPALPRALAFAADESLVWSAWSGASPGFNAISAAGGVVARDTSVASAGGSISVAAADGAEAVFELVQIPWPDAQSRRTLVRRVSALAELAGGVLGPAWEHDVGFTTNGPARVACDAAGAVVLVATWRSGAGDVRLDRLDAASGALHSSTTHAGAALSDLSLASDGSCAAIAAGLDLWIVDAGGAPLHHASLAASTAALAISGDGALVAHGGAVARVLARAGGSYAQSFDVAGEAGEIAARIALSRDASTLAIAWWNAALGSGLRFEVVDVASRARLFVHAQRASGSPLQNFPEVVRLTPDGARAALGAWGDGGARPEVVLFDRASGASVLEIDLPGSCQGLALDRSGRRVAVSMKSVHANELGNRGEVRLYDTGERALALVATPWVGGEIALAAKRPGAATAIFLEGAPSAVPLSIPGVGGTLLLRRVGLSAWRRACDASGRADLSLPLPLDPSTIGTTRWFQAAFRTGGTTTLDVERVGVLVL